MAYADYTFYTEQYFGNTISGSEFPRLAARASSFLDYYTMGKAKRNPNLEALKMACCAVAEHYQTIEAAKSIAGESISAASTGAKKSETVGSYSVSYVSGEESAKNALSIAADAQSALAAIAQRYLVGTGLLYRGGCHVYSTCCDRL